MAKVELKDGKLVYKKMLMQKEIPAADVVWAYLQQEPVNARICCGRASFEIGRLVVIDRSGRREIFQYEGLDEPKRILDGLSAANPSMAVGYTDENRARFGA